MSGPDIFVGRTSELAQLDVLTRENARLITLWGPGGAGKTTLARKFSDREKAAGSVVVWADLAAARSERDVLASLARALDVNLDRDDPFESIFGAAAAQSALLVADNAEQLDAAARAILITIAERRVPVDDTKTRSRTPPPPRMLVTSRDALGAASERAVRIDPLSESEGLALYAALSGTAADEAAREIVRRLDALPLAIELAAARAPLLGSAALLERLDRKLDVLGGPADRSDRPARHATLRAAIGWSWDLLDDVDKNALIACATFEGAFDAILAARVIAPNPDDEIVAMDALERLRQRALVHVKDRAATTTATSVGSPPQLHLLEAVRDFARAQVAAPQHSAGPLLLNRHARAVVELAEPLALALRRGGAIDPALSRRRADLARIIARSNHPASDDARNVDHEMRARALICLAALDAVTGPADPIVERVDFIAPLVRDVQPALAARLEIMKAQALRAMGRLEDASTAAKGALDAATSIANADPHAAQLLRADALRVNGAIARSRGRADEAIDLLQNALESYRALDERAFAGITLGEIGAAQQSAGMLERAIDSHAQAIAVHVAEKSIRAEGVDRSFLAVATHRKGEPANAVALHEAALAIHRRVGHRRLEGAELLHLGFVQHELGAPGPARAAFEEARRVLGLAGARGLQAFAIVLAARLEVDEGNTVHARVALAEAAYASPSGWARLLAARHTVAGHLALSTNDPSTAALEYEAALAASRDVEVGFEALTPAYLALARSRVSPPPSAITSGLEEARALVARVSNPHIATALAVIERGALGATSTSSAIAPEACASSSEVRRALSFIAPGSGGIKIADDARQLVLPDGREIDLSRRKNVRLILVALANARREQPGVPLTGEALIETGWPGERMRGDAGTKRLHTAIWTLRSLGLEDILISLDDGYLLDPKIRLDLT